MDSIILFIFGQDFEDFLFRNQFPDEIDPTQFLFKNIGTQMNTDLHGSVFYLRLAAGKILAIVNLPSY
jgi:hypothetical protein